MSDWKDTDFNDILGGLNKPVEVKPQLKQAPVNPGGFGPIDANTPSQAFEPRISMQEFRDTVREMQATTSQVRKDYAYFDTNITKRFNELSQRLANLEGAFHNVMIILNEWRPHVEDLKNGKK